MVLVKGNLITHIGFGAWLPAVKAPFWVDVEEAGLM